MCERRPSAHSRRGRRLALWTAGNVWEWTQSEGDLQCLRGGSWVNGNTLAQCDKRSNTKDAHSYVKGNTLGFRCAH